MSAPREGGAVSAPRDGLAVIVPGFRPARRAALRAMLAAVAASAGGLAFAQDPRSGAAQRAARDWLELADRLDTAAAYAAAGAKFKQSLPAQRWAQALVRQREPFGALVQRTMVGTQFDKSPPGLPPGDYAVVKFRTAFAKRAGATEMVTLDREADGTWRVVGYVIG
jgi:hypothetical protein